jgi:hypothetical protein
MLRGWIEELAGVLHRMVESAELQKSLEEAPLRTRNDADGMSCGKVRGVLDVAS